MVDLRGRLSNPDVQAALDRLARMLGDLDLTTPRNEPPIPRPAHKLAHRLDPEKMQQLLIAYQQGAAVKELVDRYKISKTSVLGLLHANGVPVRSHRQLSDAEVHEAAELYTAGWSLAQIGQKLSADDETIRGRLRRAGVRMRGCHERRPRQA